MTLYSVSDNQREYMYFGIAVISISLSATLIALIPRGYQNIIIPSGFLLYGLIILLFDSYLWKIRPFSWFVRIPDLNGVWIGTNQRFNEDGKLDKGKPKEDWRVTIEQTWRKINIHVVGNKATSDICSASLIIGNRHHQTLNYIYDVKPKGSSTDRFGQGFTNLTIENEGGRITLKGLYFSSHFRGGNFELTRK